MKTPFPIFRIFSVASIILLAAPDRVDARGFRGGGSRVSRPAARPAPSRPIQTRPAPSRPVQSRPAPSRPVTSQPIKRPATVHQPVNRTPSLGTRPAVPAVQPRPRSTNPKVQPLFNGSPADRSVAARNRMGTAMKRDPATVARLQNTQIQASRVTYRRNWGNSVRTRSVLIRGNAYNSVWISARINRFPQRWYYWHRPYPYTWWWRSFAWSRVGVWITYDWGDPFYYDYGNNVYYEDDSIWVNDEPVASYDDYVNSSEALAESFEEPSDDAETEWESLGTWMLSTDSNAQDSRMMLQLVLGKDHSISGSYYNTETDATQQVQGAVDPDSQRVSFTIGKKKTTILETGLANLTKEECPVWVHFTDSRKTQNWLMVRVEPPEEDKSK